MIHFPIVGIKDVPLSFFFMIINNAEVNILVHTMVSALG